MPKSKLRVGFIHPDLGIGGAERLVVDAALALQKRGHDVAFFTSHHDPNRCFEETRDGTLKVTAYPPPIPRSINGKFHVLCAILRQLHLLFYLLIQNQASTYDVFFVDSLSTCIPFLRYITGKRVVFYCHFPDKVLSMGTYSEDNRRYESLLKRLYRAPVDILEEFTTGDSDVILANSKFTASVIGKHLPSIADRARVVYPGINTDSYKPLPNQEKETIYSDRPTFLSLNRFEPKKNVLLAVKSFARLRDLNPSLFTGKLKPRLVLGGGYDSRLKDNVQTLQTLQQTLTELDLSFHILEPSSPTSTSTSTAAPSAPSSPSHFSSPTSTSPLPTTDVLLLLNYTSTHRSTLLNSPSTLSLLYTPTNEHFGIGPLEGMISGLPILACNSGGPLETIINIDTSSSSSSSSASNPYPNETDETSDFEFVGTGYLRPPKPTEWALTLSHILTLPPSVRARISQNAKKRVKDHFALESLSRGVQQAVDEAVSMGVVRWGYGLSLVGWLVGFFVGFWVFRFFGVFI